jgi:hypothetical protein
VSANSAIAFTVARRVPAHGDHLAALGVEHHQGERTLIVDAREALQQVGRSACRCCMKRWYRERRDKPSKRRTTSGASCSRIGRIGRRTPS